MEADVEGVVDWKEWKPSSNLHILSVEKTIESEVESSR